MKTIYLPIEKKREILALKWDVKGVRRKVSEVTLQSALNYITQTPLARTLRAAAIERGGVIYDDSVPRNFVPDCTTEFDHINGIVRQELSNGITLEIHKKDNLAIAYKDAVEIARFEDMTLNKWSKVLFSLQKLYTHLNAM